MDFEPVTNEEDSNAIEEEGAFDEQMDDSTVQDQGIEIMEVDNNIEDTPDAAEVGANSNIQNDVEQVDQGFMEDGETEIRTGDTLELQDEDPLQDICENKAEPDTEAVSEDELPTEAAAKVSAKVSDSFLSHRCLFTDFLHPLAKSIRIIFFRGLRLVL